MPLAISENRCPKSAAVSSPVNVASNDAAPNFCANSPMVCATCLPVAVPAWRALRRASRSSGRTLSLVPSATWPTVSRKSCSSFFRLASACLSSLSEKLRPLEVSCLSASPPASAEVRNAWSSPLQRLGHRLAHAGVLALRAQRRAFGHRAHHLADAVAVEAPALQRAQRDLVHLGADVGALADGLAGGLADLRRRSRRWGLFRPWCAPCDAMGGVDLLVCSTARRLASRCHLPRFASSCSQRSSSRVSSASFCACRAFRARTSTVRSW